MARSSSSPHMPRLPAHQHNSTSDLRSQPAVCCVVDVPLTREAGCPGSPAKHSARVTRIIPSPNSAGSVARTRLANLPSPRSISSFGHKRVVEADPEAIFGRHPIERQDFQRAPPLAAVRCDQRRDALGPVAARAAGDHVGDGDGGEVSGHRSLRWRGRGSAPQRRQTRRIATPKGTRAGKRLASPSRQP